MNHSATLTRSTGPSRRKHHSDVPGAALSLSAIMLRWLIVMSTCLFAASRAAADDPSIIRVEEDWRVEVGTPEPEDHAPQIVTVLSPVGNLEREHSVFELNHASFPDYTSGGMQLQFWRQDWLWGYGSTPHHQKLYHDNEVITFTSTMLIDGSFLEFQIVNGVSQTWSTFGGNGYLKTRYYTTLDDLDEYSPDVSAANSRVAFASHRVRKLVLTQVRYYSEDGLVATDSTPRIVHEHTPE